MTYKEKLKAEHPDYTEVDIDDVLIRDCPYDHWSEAAMGKYCNTNADEDSSCGKCWHREVAYTDAIKVPETVIDKFNEIGNVNVITPEETRSVIKDSGDRTEFESGAVRDMREGKGRCDLMPLYVVSHILGGSSIDHDPILRRVEDFRKTGNSEYLYNAISEFVQKHGWGAYDYDEANCTMLLEVAKHFEEGAKKYGENNWQKGIPAKCYIDSAVRHYLKWLRDDKDEPHDRAFVWNLMCCIWEVDYGEEYRASKN